ncbi:MAG: Cna B-type domain-containing protein, partial [Eubacterium sp.]|nr:Cna B-type domain-containing protein [Eubacterium sp.]
EEGGNAGGDDNNQAGGEGQIGGNGQNSGNEGEERQEITYSVKEVETDVITGVDGEGTYAISYETKHEENENDNWVINVTNTHTTKKLTVEKKWVDKDGKDTDWKPESVKVVLQHKKGAGNVTPEPENPQESGSTSEPGENPPAGNDQESGNGPESGNPQEGGNGAETPSTDTDTWETIGEPVELNVDNAWKAEFKDKGLTESSVANGEWRIRELDADGKLIFAEGDEDAPKDEKDNTKSVLNNEIVLNVEKDGKNKDVPYVVSYEVDDGTGKESDGETGGESSSTSSSETGSTSSSETGEENTSTNSTKGNTVITNKVNGKEVTVEKSWDIDFAKKDHPESIEVVIQEKKEDDKWDTVALLELNGDNDWKDSRFLPDKRDDKEIEYRARELRQETALEEIVKKLKETISSGVTGEYDQIIGQIKDQAGDYYTMLPTEIQDAAQQGSDKLKDQLKTTTENLYDKLLEKIGIAASEDRIVYDKDDKDKKTDDGKKEEDKSGDDQKDGEGGEKDKEQDVEKEKEKERKKSELNTVTYYVKEDNSVIPGTEGGTEGTGGSGESGHNTKYRVTYGKDGDTLKITNKAILEVDVIKRWIGIGVDDEDMPDAAWVVLMFSLDTEKIGKAGGEIGSEALGSFAKSINVNVNDLEGYEFPVFNLGNVAGKETPFLLEEGQDPLAIISQLTIGVDLDIFGSFLPKMAIARVTKDDDWRVHYVVSKYAMGLPVNFKGAELGSELIRQIIKYVTGLNLFISYNPFDNFISIPTKAIPKFLDITDPKDLLDVSGLAGKALNKVKGLTSEELKNIGLNTFMDGSDLMANVINVKIDWDTSQDQILTKAWVGDEEENRPEYIEVYLKDGEQELEEPVKLEKKDFKGENTWTYDLSELDKDEENTGDSEDKDKEKTEHAYSVVREEYPEGYEHANDYDCKVDGLTITNTWKDPEKVTISGKKIWEDDDDKDGIRPEKITVKLLADGEEIKSVETSKEGGWKYHFADLPKYKDASKDEEIVYTIEEEETDVITGEDGEGTYAWEVKEGSYDLVNTHTPAKITIEGTKEWDDADNQDGKRPDSITIRLKADGKEVDSVKVEEGQDGSWSWKFEDQPKTNGGKDITYTITEDKVEGYTTKIEGDAEKGFTVTNTYTPGKTQIKVTKVWDDKKDQDGNRPESVTVKLLADGEPVKDEEGSEVTLELSEDNSWTGTFEDLDEKKDGNAIDYSVEEETDDVITGEDGEGTYSVKVSGDMQKGFTVTNKHTPQTIRIEGKKVWEDENDQAEKRPDSIVIRLKAGGEEIRNRKVTNSNSWTWTFEGLPKNADGEEIEYTITEDSIPDYTTEIEGDAADGFTVTNTYAPGKTQIAVTKAWKDDNDRDGIRPKSVTIRLLADGEEVKGEDDEPVTLVLSEGNSWTGSFADLPKYKEAEGEGSQDSEAEKTEIVYTIGEETTDVITGEDGSGTYAVEISGNAEKGFTVTNTHTPETAAVTVKKVWNDANNQDKKRPESITFRLLADGKEIRTQEVKEADEWSWSVDGLPKKQDGKEITYTVTEDTVPEYTTAIEGDATDGFTVTNTYTPGKTQVNVVKVWNDKEDQDGIRPTSVTVSLLADGEETGKTLVLSEGTKWSGTFTDLDVMKDGKAIAYTVNEKQTDVITGTDGPGTYEIKITGDAAKGFTVTNKHTPATLAFEGVKVWNDAENQDGKRPASIRIRLKANGKDKVVKTVTAEDGWKWSYTNLPKYDGDKEIVYTLTEDAVPEYTTSVEGSPQEGFTVTNTYNPGKTQVTVTKVWSDENDYDAIRPEKVKIFLLADGTRTRKDAELSEKNNWTYTFENLDVSKDGTEIRYTVEEDLTRVITGTDGDGTYAVNIKGTAAKGFTVTNTHTPQKIRIEVAKVWDDAENQDGKRPESVTIKLLADGKPVEVEGGGLLNLLGNTSPYTVTLSEETGWKGVFTGLDKKKLTDKGEWVDIVYTVEEELTNVITGKDGPGTYVKDDKKGDAENGFTVINTHTPETVTVEGKKTWTDSENQDGVRPQSITIRLLDGSNEIVGQPITVTPDKDGVWKWTFTDLPKYKNGSVIKYKVTEDVVKDYTAAYAEPVLDEKNGIWTCDITNTHTPGKTQVSVFKVWKDALNGKDDADGIRPKSVTVKLLADGIPAKDKEGKERTLTLSESTGWSGTFTDLDAMSKGKEITYTVGEVLEGVVTGTDGEGTYKTEVTGDAGIGFTVTNTHTPLLKITYDLNGGTFAGSPDNIVELYPYGTEISIHPAPVRAGYTFLYWKGSEYRPGDKYTVMADHTFVAQWAPAATPTITPIPGTPVNPANGPKTGDSSHMLEWLIVLLAAAAGLTGMALYRKKRGTGGNS